MYLVTFNGQQYLSFSPPTVEDLYDKPVEVSMNILVECARALYDKGQKAKAVKLLAPAMPNKSLKEAMDFIDEHLTKPPCN
jgi:hypothetical protein